MDELYQAMAEQTLLIKDMQDLKQNINQKKKRGMMKKITLNAEHVSAAMAHQSNDITSEVLNGILLAKNGDIVGTDGNSLFLANDGMEEANRPLVDTIIKIDSVVPISTDWIEIDLEGSVVECWSKSTVKIKKLIPKKLIPFRVVLGKFPAYEKVIPEEAYINQTYNDTVTLTAKMLLKMAKTWGKDASLTIKSNGVNEPLSITSSEHTGLIIVMPCRSTRGKIGHDLVRRESVPRLDAVA